MKCSLGISSFLEEISSLSHSIVFLYFAEEGFLISLLFLGTLHSNGNILPFLLCFSLLFFSQLFVRPPQTAILPFCISFSCLYAESKEKIEQEALLVLARLPTPHSGWSKTRPWPPDWFKLCSSSCKCPVLCREAGQQSPPLLDPEPWVSVRHPQARFGTQKLSSRPFC